MNTVGSLLKASALGEYAPTVDQYMELYKSYIGFFDTLSMPWSDTATYFQDIYKRMMSGNPDAMKEYFNMMNEAYKNSFGQVLNMSSFGLYKDNIEAQMQGIDSYVQFMFLQKKIWIVFIKLPTIKEKKSKP